MIQCRTVVDRKIRPSFKRSFIPLSAFCVLQVLAGCADQPTLIDQQFGVSLQTIKAQQAVHPYGTETSYPPLVSEGVIGKSAIDRYHRSFEQPLQQPNIFNIGVGTPMTTQQPTR
jgi:hypothetical protein